MGKHMIRRMHSSELEIHTREHGYQYVCRVTATQDIIVCDKLPPILKALRKDVGHTFKIPHGNKVRTMILEGGMCPIYYNGEMFYEIVVKRW